MEIEEELPLMSAGEVRMFIGSLTGLVLMGVTRLEFHPARWPMVFNSLIKHRAIDLDQVRWLDDVEDMDHALIMVQLGTGDDQHVFSLLRQRGDHDDETVGERAAIDASAYPGPADDGPRILMPEDFS